jgi:hypothetical protein
VFPASRAGGRIARLLYQVSNTNYKVFGTLVAAVRWRKDYFAAGKRKRTELLQKWRDEPAPSTGLETALKGMAAKLPDAKSTYNGKELFAACFPEGLLKENGDMLLSINTATNNTDQLERAIARVRQCLKNKDEPREKLEKRAKRDDELLLKEHERAALVHQAALHGRISADIAGQLFSVNTLRAAGVCGIDPGMRNAVGAVTWTTDGDGKGRFLPWRLTGRHYFRATGQDNDKEHGSTAAGDARKAEGSKRRQKREAAIDRLRLDVVAEMRRMAKYGGNNPREPIAVIGTGGYGGGHGHRRPGARKITDSMSHLMLVVEMDKFRTSLLCPRCSRKSECVRGQLRAKECPHCEKHRDNNDPSKRDRPFMWDRDTAAAYTMVRLLANQYDHGMRLEAYCRDNDNIHNNPQKVGHDE